VKNEVQDFVTFCLAVSRPNATAVHVSDKQIDTFLMKRDTLRDTLFTALFE